MISRGFRKTTGTVAVVEEVVDVVAVAVAEAVDAAPVVADTVVVADAALAAVVSTQQLRTNATINAAPIKRLRNKEHSLPATVIAPIQNAADVGAPAINHKPPKTTKHNSNPTMAKHNVLTTPTMAKQSSQFYLKPAKPRPK